MISAQEEELEEAEINAILPDDLPRIKVSGEEWTSIDIVVEDRSGLNWSVWEKYPYVTTHILWPIMFGKEVLGYIGYTSLIFEPEIASGNAEGWEFEVDPSTVGDTTRGITHNLVFRAKVDKLAADYSVVARVKVTRIDALGKEGGVSYFYIPLKAEPYNFIQMMVDEPRVKTPPKSIVEFDIKVTNQGLYEDIFSFNAKTTNDDVFASFSHGGLFLKPGETKTVKMSVLTQEEFFDPGTPTQFDIYVSSIKDPEEILIGNVVVITEGFFFSPFVISTIIIVIFILIFLFLLTKKVIVRLPKKTEKIKSIKEKQVEQKRKKEPESIKIKKIGEPIQEKPKLIEEKKLSAEQIKKEKEIQKIKKQQEKQRRKLGR